MIRTVILMGGLLLATIPAFGGLGNKKAAYVGGTLASLKAGAEGTLQVSAADAASFQYDGGQLSIPYNKVESIEYGQKAGRRVGVAIAVSPLALFSKKRKHFLTISFLDAEGKKQGAVFELGKDIPSATPWSTLRPGAESRSSTSPKRPRSTSGTEGVLPAPPETEVYISTAAREARGAGPATSAPRPG